MTGLTCSEQCSIFCFHISIAQFFKHIAISAGGLGFDQMDTMSPTAPYRFNVSSELCCPDARDPPLVAHFGVISRA